MEMRTVRKVSGGTSDSLFTIHKKELDAGKLNLRTYKEDKTHEQVSAKIIRGS